MARIPDTANNPFATWFARSVVLDGSSAPLLCYHASDQQIVSFQPFTHFGTLSAAKRRARDKRICEPKVHEVYLALAKPLEVIDDQADNNPLRLLDFAVQQQVLSTIERQTLLKGVGDVMGQATMNARSTADHVSLKWNSGMTLLSERLISHGYDGLKYQNQQEGGISFVNFRSNQVWQVGKEMHD